MCVCVCGLEWGGTGKGGISGMGLGRVECVCVEVWCGSVCVRV